VRVAGLEIRGPAVTLLDEPLLLHARGAGPGAPLAWQARYLDDDARVWRAAAPRAQDLSTGFTPAKAGTGPLAALASLRPLSVEVRVQADDGRAAARTLTRRLVGDGVKLRRWRDGPAATLHLPPPGGPPRATLMVDGTASPGAGHVATLAAPLLASRGVLVLAVGPPRGDGRVVPGQLAGLGDRLSAVPGAGDPVVLLAADPLGAQGADAGPGTTVVLPPGVGARDADPGAGAQRARAWDALLADLGAEAREPAGGQQPARSEPGTA
jgi:hypothetical protein